MIFTVPLFDLIEWAIIVIMLVVLVSIGLVGIYISRIQDWWNERKKRKESKKKC